MKNFEEYFTNKEILRILCKKRAILAKKGHDKLFIKGVIKKNKVYKFEHEIYKLFPARNDWIRLNKKERRNKNAVQVNSLQLERTVLRQTKKFKKNPTLEWEINLYGFIDSVKEILHKKYNIPSPVIIGQHKEGTTYRPISNFDLKDRIIISQTNKYLSNCFDPFFMDCSYAFRVSKKNGKSYTHHKAIEDIINYKKLHLSQDIWVSECDIKKFYDCINHNVIRYHFDLKVSECLKKNIMIDKRAKEIFNSYLDCYSFNNYVKAKMEKAVLTNGEFGWVTKDELLSVKSNPERNNIGVPQGGALSCLIANLVMDTVDKEVLKMHDTNLFYARFCDDMVIMHTKVGGCKKALSNYQDGLKKVKLIYHTIKEINSYPGEFWKSKSKAPYKWSKNVKNKSGDEKNVPWLSFVGYQVSYDLRIRIRKSSIKKELEKQIKETSKIVSIIRKKQECRISEKAIRFRHIQRLLSMSVGRKNIFDIHKSGQMCWTAGFRILKDNNFVKYHICHLDKKRCEQIRRLQNSLDSMDPKNRPHKNPHSIMIDGQPKFFGSPFSYFFQFNNK